MTKDLNQYRDAAEKVIAQAVEAYQADIARGGEEAISARLQLAVMPEALRAVAAEADLGTSREEFQAAALGLLQSVACTLAGYFGEGPRGFDVAGRLLLSAGVGITKGDRPGASFSETCPAPSRGETQ